MASLIRIFIASCIALSATTTLAQTPSGFDQFSDNALFVTYPEGLQVSPPGIELSPAQAASQPEIGTQEGLEGTYVVLMVDPDAPSRANPSRAEIWHWGQANLTSSSSSSSNPSTNASFASLLTSPTTTPPIVEYRGPMPPPGSGPHRYIFLLYRQPEDFAVPGSYAGYGGMNRSRFDVADFAEAAGLGEPVAANYFTSQNLSSANSTGSTVSMTGTPMPSASVAPPSGNPSTVPFLGEAAEMRTMGCAGLIGLITMVVAGFAV